METFLVGYGTLLYRKSLGSSIGADAAAEKKVIPVTIKDYRRLFNLRPDSYISTRMLSTEDIEAAAANVEPAKGHSFNGLGFSVTPEELVSLDKREAYYERQVVPLYAFDDDSTLVGEGHVYVSPLNARWINRDIEQLLPRFRDVIWARNGAYEISQAFGETYDATTYLADGTTLIGDLYGDKLDKYDEEFLR
jgi:hypothetical protein